MCSLKEDIEGCYNAFCETLLSVTQVVGIVAEGEGIIIGNAEVALVVGNVMCILKHKLLMMF